MNRSSKLLNKITKESITITRPTKPRSRRKTKTSSSILSNDIPTFQQFMHRQQVIHQYRDFFKAIRSIRSNNDYNTHESMQNEVRISYKRYVNEQDPLTVSMAIKEGARRLKEFKSMVGYHGSGSSNNGDDGTDLMKNNNSIIGTSNANDSDSWLNIDDKDDPRGRVGTNWPWDDSRQ